MHTDLGFLEEIKTSADGFDGFRNKRALAPLTTVIKSRKET